MKVLVIGSGGREHALGWKLSQSPHCSELFFAPGNAGTESLGRSIDLKTNNTGALAVWAVENKIDLTVVGPEAPLADGVVDVFTEHGLRIFGPTKAAARLESSKSFAKEVLLKAGVPTAKAQTFSDFSEAKRYVEHEGAPIVIKADGLAAGKGVVVAESLEEAYEALNEFMKADRFGSAGKTVVLEQKLSGKEASMMAIVDGNTVLPLVISQDYKRVFDGDIGPNTGGMGAISPTPVLPDSRVGELINEIYVPILKELMARGISYTGFLYAGLMVDKTGLVRVLEFNCRLGDPETQVIMMRLQSDLLTTIAAAANKELASIDLAWSSQAAACVVACSGGYPGTVDDGKIINGLFQGDERAMLFYSGAIRSNEQSKAIVSKGGRVLSVTAIGKDVSEACARAYQGMEAISFDGMHYRRDIGRG